MLRTVEDDLSGLAHMARACAGNLRPLVLRAQTESFVATPFADLSLMRTYEALALGLIPLVSDDVIAEVERLLRSGNRTPASVAIAIAHRLERPKTVAAKDAGAGPGARVVLDRTQIAELLTRDRPDIDLMLSVDRGLVIDGYSLRELVGRARRRPRLARALLAREEPTVFDRATLYRHADETRRDAIRRGLARAPLIPGGQDHDPGLTALILDAADRGDVGRIAAALAGALDMRSPPRWRLASMADRELFASALLAIGLSRADCLRVCLLLCVHDRLGTRAMLRLAAVIRTLTSAAATFLAAGDRIPDARAGTCSRQANRPLAAEFDRSRRRLGEPAAGHLQPGERSLAVARA